MICFTASTKPTGGNFSLAGASQGANDAVVLPGAQGPNALARSQYSINATDFTKDEYDQSMGRGPMWNHDHFYLPVYQIRCQVKNVIYKSNSP